MRELSFNDMALVSGGVRPTDDEVSPVTVTAPGHIGPFGNFAWQASHGSGIYVPLNSSGGVASPTGNSGTPFVPANDHTLATLSITNPANLAAGQAALNALNEYIAGIDYVFDSVADTAAIQMPNGAVISGAQLKDIWHHTEYVITDKAYGSGYGGSNTPGSINHVEFNFATIGTTTSNAGYAAWPAGTGLGYIVLHEIGHDTPTGALNDVIGKQGYAGDPSAYYLTSSFQDNERYANQFANQASKALGITIMQPNSMPYGTVDQPHN
jgi:hypothetical protein